LTQWYARRILLSMKRITVTLTDDQAVELVAIAEGSALPVSALVRSAVDKFLSDRAIFLPSSHTVKRQSAAVQVATEVAG
jgi:hypothetical protein